MASITPNRLNLPRPQKDQVPIYCWVDRRTINVPVLTLTENRTRTIGMGDECSDHCATTSLALFIKQFFTSVYRWFILDYSFQSSLGYFRFLRLFFPIISRIFPFFAFLSLQTNIYKLVTQFLMLILQFNGFFLEPSI